MPLFGLHPDTRQVTAASSGSAHVRLRFQPTPPPTDEEVAVGHQGVEVGVEAVFDLEDTSSEIRGQGGLDGVQLLRRIRPEVDLGGLQARVAQPERDLPDVPRRLEAVDRTGVAVMPSSA